MPSDGVDFLFDNAVIQSSDLAGAGRNMNFKALRTIIGSVLIHISLGTVYTAGNMISYIISYLHVLKEQAVRCFFTV